MKRFIISFVLASDLPQPIRCFTTIEGLDEFDAETNFIVNVHDEVWGRVRNLTTEPEPD